MSFPSGSVITRNTSIRIALLVHHCKVDTYIRVHAVDHCDHCDRNGSSTNGILAQVLTATHNTEFFPESGITSASVNQESSELHDILFTYVYYYADACSYA